MKFIIQLKNFKMDNCKNCKKKIHCYQCKIGKAKAKQRTEKAKFELMNQLVENVPLNK